MGKYGWSNNNLIANKITANELILNPGVVIEGDGTTTNGLVLKNVKTLSAGTLAGTARDVEILLGTTKYYFKTYPTRT